MLEKMRGIIIVTNYQWQLQIVRRRKLRFVHKTTQNQTVYCFYPEVARKTYHFSKKPRLNLTQLISFCVHLQIHWLKIFKTNLYLQVMVVMLRVLFRNHHPRLSLLFLQKERREPGIWMAFSPKNNCHKWHWFVNFCVLMTQIVINWTTCRPQNVNLYKLFS